MESRIGRTASRGIRRMAADEKSAQKRPRRLPRPAHSPRPGMRQARGRRSRIPSAGAVRGHAAARLQPPSLVEEPGLHDLSRPSGTGGRVEVHDGVVRQLRALPRVVQVVVLPEREPAVQDYISLRIQRIRIDQDRYVVVPGEFLGANLNLSLIPRYWQLFGNPGDKLV